MMTDVQVGDTYLHVFLPDQVECLRGLKKLFFLFIELLLIEIQFDFILPEQFRQGLPDFLIEIQGQVELPIPIVSNVNPNHVKVFFLVLFEQAGPTDTFECISVVEEEIPLVDFLNSRLRIRQDFFVFAIPCNQHSVVFTYVVFRKIASHVPMQKVDFFLQLQEGEVVLIPIRVTADEHL